MDEDELFNTLADEFIELCRQNGLSYAQALDANQRLAEFCTDKYLIEAFAQKKRRSFKVIGS